MALEGATSMYSQLLFIKDTLAFLHPIQKQDIHTSIPAKITKAQLQNTKTGLVARSCSPRLFGSYCYLAGTELFAYSNALGSMHRLSPIDLNRDMPAAARVLYKGQDSVIVQHERTLTIK
jgi:hypothetical protein